MPAGMSWKEIYQLEYYQMQGEGYDVSALPSGRTDASEIANHLEAVNASEEDDKWQSQYEKLAMIKSKGLSSDYGYLEPDEIDEIFALADDPPVLVPLPEEEYANRVKGAWFARCAAVVLGKPLEMGMDRLRVKEYLESVNAYPLKDWVPEYSDKLNIRLRTDCLPSTLGNVRYVQSDDDIHYTISSLLLAEKAGADFTAWQAAQNLLENIPYNWVWTADKFLYYQLVNCDSEREFNANVCAQRNPWRESMCPQLKADLWGYITPGMMRRGAVLIHRLGRLSATKNGLYGGMFIQGCVSAALSGSPDVADILRGGLGNIPRTSRLYEAVTSVMEWYKTLQNWTQVCDRIYEVYGHWYFAGAINNICFIVLALLEGQLDLERTMCTAVMCGTDTDCNSANAGSIVGAAIGYDALPDKWIKPLNDEVHSGVANFGFGSITELASRTVQVGQRIRREIQR